MSIDYKDTLNLPKTDFAMKANLAQREPQMLKAWQESNVYQKLREQRKGKEKFILHDGPPYANGKLHVGHGLNKILKDIVVKSKSMSGYDSPYVPGWDCHGLPIELNVEKKVGKVGVKVTAKEFRQACRKYASSQINIQRESFKRLGVFGDWDNPYLSMDYTFEANIIRSLAKIIANGHLHRGYKPVHWCTDCGSSLAEAEVEYADKRSPAIDVRFQVVAEEALFAHCEVIKDKGHGPISLPIWTTTPWTLPANQAVALHPNLEYALIQCVTEHGAERLLVAHGLLQDVLQRYNISDYQILSACPGKNFEGLKLQHPFYDREVPVVLGEHVTTDAGTGCVHTAPGHGPDDYALGVKYNLSVEHPVGSNGCFLPDTPLFANEHVSKANDHIIEVLKTNNKLLHITAIEHSYPHCWRHKTPVIFRATPQWFISMDQKHLRDNAIEAIFKTTWIPAWGRERIANMVEQRPDWCISRQRFWGTPIPLFIHKKTGEIHPNSVVLMEKVAQLVEKNSVDAWDDVDPQQLLGDDAEHYEKIHDILDVWFESGVSHACVLQENAELQYPADIYLEGSDQHRGWFQSSLMTSVAMHGQAPYKAVLTHGFTVDAEGRKLSKSLGNYIELDKLVNQSGADIMRLWVSSTDYTAEVTVTDEVFKRISDVYRRLRNTARFLLANLHDFDPKVDQIKVDDLLALDTWLIERTQQLQQEIVAAYDNYQFHVVYQKVHHFCSIELGGFYLDIIKDRQYTTQKNSLARRSTQTAMYYVLDALVRWLAPIISFTAEEIWKYIPGERVESVFFSEWFQDFPQLTKQFDQAFWQTIITVRDAVNKEVEVQRNAGVVGSALAAEVDLYCLPELYKQLKMLGDELHFIFLTSAARVHEQVSAGTNTVETDIEGLCLKVAPSSHKKCIRCWHCCEDVGQNAEHPEICSRCVGNVVGEGEVRKFA